MVNNSTNIKKNINTSHLKPFNTKHITTYGVVNPGSGWRETQTCVGLISINGISAPLLRIGSEKWICKTMDNLHGFGSTHKGHTLSQIKICVSRQLEPGFTTPYVVICFVLNGLR
jgi:hypothetical protein